MRIAYLSGSRIPSRKANSIQVMKMCEAFAEAGHDVTLYGKHGEAGVADPYSWYGTARTFQLDLYEKPAGERLSSLKYALAVSRRIGSRGAPDFLYGRHSQSLAAAVRSGVPFAFEAHQLPPPGLERRLQSWLLRRRHARNLVVISEALKQDYLLSFPWLEPDRVLVAHSGSSPVAGETPADGGPWPSRAGALQVGYVGHLYPGRGTEIIMSLAERLPEADFHLIGGNEREIATWQGEGNPANVRFHGFMPPSGLAACFPRLDLVLAPYQRKISPSGYERRPAGEADIGRWISPMKIFEYMAHGKAMVVSDLPTLTEVLRDDETALVCPPDDVGAWETAIRRLAADPEVRNRLGEAARAEFAGKYSWQARAGRILDMLTMQAA